MKDNKKSYNNDFKIKAVMLSFEKNSIDQVAKNLNISSRSLLHWRKSYIINGPISSALGKIKLSPEEKKMYELEKKLKNSISSLRLSKVQQIIFIKGDFIFSNLSQKMNINIPVI